MLQQKLGSQGCQVSPIGLGCMGLTEGDSPTKAQDIKATLKMAVSAGINFFDTADSYAGGENECLIGEALSNKSKRVVIASKCGIKRQGQYQATVQVDNSAAYIRQACDASLKRLKREVIDLYYLHRYDPTIPIEATMQVFADLVQAGKIRYVGICTEDAEHVSRAHAVHPLTAVQSEYSLWARQAETAGLMQTCQRLGIGFVATSPLLRGLLTAKFTTSAECTQADNNNSPIRQTFAAVSPVIEVLCDLAREKGCSPAQYALAWVLAQNVVAIPGTRGARYCAEYIEAVNLVHLSEAECQRLDKIVKRQQRQYPGGVESRDED